MYKFKINSINVNSMNEIVIVPKKIMLLLGRIILAKEDY